MLRLAYKLLRVGNSSHYGATMRKPSKIWREGVGVLTTSFTSVDRSKCGDSTDITNFHTPVNGFPAF